MRCGDTSILTAPEIGAVVDGGMTLEDLGIILQSGDPLNCDARKGCWLKLESDTLASAIPFLNETVAAVIDRRRCLIHVFRRS
jgi:hypothetical protein